MRDSNLFGDEHVRKYEETGGKVGHDWNDTQVLILHTKGRKSGVERKNPLIYGRDGNDYLIVASKGGAPSHPDWYVNLMANPNTTIQVWSDLVAVTARNATPEEKKRLWPTMTAQWPDYDAYQQRTERDIPLVILSPRK
jgi:deazaflavin-dependent oxidoreductase (nitroreductase family)